MKKNRRFASFRGRGILRVTVISFILVAGMMFTILPSFASLHVSASSGVTISITASNGSTVCTAAPLNGAWTGSIFDTCVISGYLAISQGTTLDIGAGVTFIVVGTSGSAGNTACNGCSGSDGIGNFGTINNNGTITGNGGSGGSGGTGASGGPGGNGIFNSGTINNQGTMTGLAGYGGSGGSGGTGGDGGRGGNQREAIIYTT